MIKLVFQTGHLYSFVNINGIDVTMGSDPSHLSPIEFCMINKATTLKEFPDLKDDKKWKEKAIERFKNHIIALGDEKTIAEYIIDDLSKCGYQLARWKNE